MRHPDDLTRDILLWYDTCARKMPWRIGPTDRKRGIRPDPYRVWLSEVMLQQTTVATVHAYFERFISLWPGLADLANARDADVMAQWAGLGYYARARNLLKCARAIVAEHDGEFPADYAQLLSLPGIGPYTAAAISAIAFDRAETVVDGNVERVMARLHDIHTPLTKAKKELTARARALTAASRAGDYAQAVMDLGATICTPRNPACGICPWRDDCLGRLRGTAVELPKKMPKQRKPIRHGIVYIARRIDGAYLLETRPDKGLLGGMQGWPGTGWTDVLNELPADAPPIQAEWKTLPAQARHSFTHFHLRLTVKTALVAMACRPDKGGFVPSDQFRRNSLPTIMRKAYDLTQDQPNTTNS